MGSPGNRKITTVQMLCLLLLVLCGCGCRRNLPGTHDLPPGVHKIAGVFHDLDPRFSPDGRRIAFYRETADRRLQLMLTDPTLHRPVAMLKPELLEPDKGFYTDRCSWRAPESLAWSPNSRYLLIPRPEWYKFPDGERLPGTGIWLLDLKSGALKPAAIHPHKYTNIFYTYRSQSWSPDGKYFAFIGQGIDGETALYVVPFWAEPPRKVVPRFDRYEAADWPVWSKTTPDRLVYRQGILRSATADPIETLRILEPGGAAHGSIFAMTPTDFRPLLHRTPTGGILPRISAPKWSPDGRWIAFALSPNSLDPKMSEIWIVRVEGSGARRVSPLDGRGYLCPEWLSNNRLTALRPDKGDYEVVEIGRDGQTVAIGRIGSTDFDFSPDRRSVVYADPGTVPPGRKTGLTLVHLKSVSRIPALR